MSASGGETSKKQVIQVDVYLPLMNNLQVVFEPLDELSSSIEIDHILKFSGGLQDYIRVRDIYHRTFNLENRMIWYKHLTTYAFLNRSMYSSIF